MRAKVSGVWRDPKYLLTKVGGSWKRAKYGYIKVAGTWRKFWIDLPSILFTGTSSGAAGNNYHYEQISNASLTIASGDTLSFDLYMPSVDANCSVEGIFSDNMTMRDFPSAANRSILDQSGVSIHPVNPTPNAVGKFYRRTFSLTPAAGKTVVKWGIAMERDAAGTYQAYFRNIVVRDSSGAVKLQIFGETLVTSALTTLDATTNGYSGISKSVVASPMV